MTKTIYLDHNATTPIDSRVVDAMNECHARYSANPASQHRSGQAARRVVEEARERIAAALGVDITSPGRDRLVFTSGGTEANNLAIRGLARDRSQRVIVSAIEHPSVLDVARDLSVNGFPVEIAPVGRTGVVDVDKFRTLVDSESSAAVQLVSIMSANNETGVLQPVEEVVDLCRDRRIPVHTDAVQAVGKIPVDFQKLGVAAMSVSAHKFQGPVGIGAIAIRRGVLVAPLHFGGQQQLGQRPGTEPVALAVGMAKAIEIRLADLATSATRMTQLRDHFERLIKSSGVPVVVNGAEPRLCQTSNVSFPGIDRQALLMALDFAGVECSTGSACSSGSSEPSHVLIAMGLPASAVASAVRFSFGPGTTEEEIEDAAARIVECVRRLKIGSTSDVGLS